MTSIINRVTQMGSKCVVVEYVYILSFMIE